MPDSDEVLDAAEDLEGAVEEAVSVCGGDPREAVRALIVLNNFLEAELMKVSYGYARGRVGWQDISPATLAQTGIIAGI